MNVIKKVRFTRISALLLAMCAGGSMSAMADDRATARSNLSNIGADLSSLRLESPQIRHNADRSSNSVMHESLIGATGRQQIIVRLRTPATSKLEDRFAGTLSAHKMAVEDEQLSFVSRCNSGDHAVKVIGRVQHVLNAVFLEVPAEALEEIASDPAVMRVAPVGHYELELSETVPYVGASAVQDLGFDGTGVSVAVLDSGVDYTHADLGGSGDPEDYAGNDGTIIEPGTFPTAKVVGGYDFLGNEWPATPDIAPDPDPLDDLALVPGAFAGHGTHVADIIGGVNGVAPGADIYAVKVCASLSSSCNGISLILGMEFSVDPNGDGDTSDHVDIINMSLGATYGQPFDDDLSAAVDNATEIGVLTVSSAGNCGDNPYCTGTPSSAPTAISVAQTQVPSALGFFMNVVEPEAAAGLYNAVKYAWTPAPPETISGTVHYGDLDGTNLEGCLPFTGDLSGLIVAVDRGSCAFSDKVRNIELAGGLAGIVMLIDDSAPFAGAFGGGDPINIPGFNISRLDGDILRAGGAVVEFGPEFSQPLVGYTVSSTARGPDMSFNGLKPEIGAPGASISAEVATGTERTPFGGTSGASPMVAGASALLIEQCRLEREGSGCTPLQIKTLLMNKAFRDVISDTTGELAEISRIGAGELRVDQSVVSSFVAYNVDDNQPSIGLGFRDVSRPTVIRKTIKVQNYSSDRKRITMMPTFRYEDDANSGAVRVWPTNRRIFVGPYQSRSVSVTFFVDPSLLSGNAMSSGSDGNNQAALTAAEFDGYLMFVDNSGEEVALPWHIIPRQAASVRAFRKRVREGQFPDSINLFNRGAGVAQNDAYSIIALSDEMPRGGRGEQMPTPDIRAVGVSTVPVDAATCASEFLWQFAINTWDRQTHLVPVSHQVAFDIDRDGVDDYILLNRDTTLNNVTGGQQLSWVIDAATGDAGAFFFAEHATNTTNTVLRACGEQLGLTSEDILTTNIDISVTSQDFYNGGPGDFIDSLTITPLGERFVGIPSGDILPGDLGALDVFDFGDFTGNTAESGVMLITNGDRGAGAHGGAMEASEAILFLSPSAAAPVPLP